MKLLLRILIGSNFNLPALTYNVRKLNIQITNEFYLTQCFSTLHVAKILIQTDASMFDQVLTHMHRDNDAQYYDWIFPNIRAEQLYLDRFYIT
ncbi:MAG: hypothetical protein FKGGLIKP_00928 [Sodalis sp. Fse]|nr:MAG: hypothetical protein FKGGLIKP_00928 [Sodalis sp. Fse]